MRDFAALGVRRWPVACNWPRRWMFDGWPVPVRWRGADRFAAVGRRKSAWNSSAHGSRISIDGRVNFGLLPGVTFAAREAGHRRGDRRRVDRYVLFERDLPASVWAPWPLPHPPRSSSRFRGRRNHPRPLTAQRFASGGRHCPPRLLPNPLPHRQPVAWPTTKAAALAALEARSRTPSPQAAIDPSSPEAIGAAQLWRARGVGAIDTLKQVVEEMAKSVRKADVANVRNDCRPGRRRR